MRELDLAIPPFVRLHRVVVAHTLRHRPGARSRAGLTLRSVRLRTQIDFPDRPSVRGSGTLARPPFCIRRAMDSAAVPLVARLGSHDREGDNGDKAAEHSEAEQVEHWQKLRNAAAAGSVGPGASASTRRGDGLIEHAIVTSIVRYDTDTNVLDIAR
eukprot:SM000109S14163  [mRNA]  locus=s109:305247:306355:+ [translate_table: standard]